MRELAEKANASKKVKKEKQKKRGRSKIQTKLRRKRNNVIDEQTVKLRESREKEKLEQSVTESGETKTNMTAPAALKRFFA